MRQEMTEGLPLETIQEDTDEAYEASTSLPVGPWEVRLVEVDGGAATVTFTAGDMGVQDETSDAEGKDLKRSLRLTRTFALPEDVDVEQLDVSLDESGVRLTLRAPKRSAIDVADVELDADGGASIGRSELASPIAVEELPVVLDEDEVDTTPPRLRAALPCKESRGKG